MFYRHKSALLSADRDDLESLVEDIVSGVADLSSNLDSLRVGQYQAIGVPGPTSKLALIIGEPSSSQPIWQRSTTHTIRIINLDKPKKGDNHIYRTSPTSSIFACPSARSHPGAYTHSLDFLVDHAEDLLDEGASIVLRPGSSAQLESAIQADNNKVDLEDIALSAPDDIEARRTILPLALDLLLCIPDLDGTMEQKGLVDKGAVADMLHQLVALWPDGNPPRAALKRVNEYLMSKRE